MNVFTNVITLVFYFFTKYCEKRFAGMTDPATGEVLTEKNKKFELKRIAELPWIFWMVMLFSLVETSGVSVFSANATEMAELRFNVDSITAGWYTSVLQYAGMSTFSRLRQKIILWEDVLMSNRILLGTSDWNIH